MRRSPADRCEVPKPDLPEHARKIEVDNNNVRFGRFCKPIEKGVEAVGFGRCDKADAALGQPADTRSRLWIRMSDQELLRQSHAPSSAASGRI